MEYNSPEIREIGRFIRAQRESADPRQFRDLPRRRRHVPYLTQVDLAELAGISPTVVSQIEQARYPNLNPSILRRLADAMQLPGPQRSYMLGLLVGADYQAPESSVPMWLVSTIKETAHPVIVVNPCFDVLVWNHAAAEMWGDFGEAPVDQRNVLVMFFTNPDLIKILPELGQYRANIVSALKMWFSQYPAWRQKILQMARRLERESDSFGKYWDFADPFTRPTTEKIILHPKHGKLDVYETVGEILGEDGLIKIEFYPSDEETRQKMAAF